MKHLQVSCNKYFNFRNCCFFSLFKCFISGVILISLSNNFVIANELLDIIVIDAGHGGKDPGTIGNSGVKEKEITLSIALKLGELIQKNFPSVKVIYTRKTDEFIEVRERTVIANRNKAKLFISIHVNHKKQEETEKNGFEIYFLNKDRFPEATEITLKENSSLNFTQLGNNAVDNFIFSNLVQTGFLKFDELLSHDLEIDLKSSTPLFSRGVIQAGFWVLLTSMPSVLIETGYISDPNDEKFLSSFNGQTNIAKALFDGFSSYKILYEMNLN